MSLCCTCKTEPANLPDARCIPCKNEANKRYHQNRKDKYHRLISDLGCECCGESHPGCLEVHHLNPSLDQRRDRIRNMFRNSKDLESGIAIVLCGNCHNLFHSHWGGKAVEFPEQTTESTISIIGFEREKYGG